jgi:hypothetical protein
MPESSTAQTGPTADDMFAREDVEKQSIEPADDESVHQTRELALKQTASHVSHHDMPPAEVPAPNNKYTDDDDDIYNKYTTSRKVAITSIMSVCSLLAPLASTTVLSAIPEVASEFNTTGSIIGISNALYMLFMGICAITWGPLGTVFGRRNVRLTISPSELTRCCSQLSGIRRHLHLTQSFDICTMLKRNRLI